MNRLLTCNRYYVQRDSPKYNVWLQINLKFNVLPFWSHNKHNTNKDNQKVNQQNKIHKIIKKHTLIDIFVLGGYTNRRDFEH